MCFTFDKKPKVIRYYTPDYPETIERSTGYSKFDLLVDVMVVAMLLAIITMKVLSFCSRSMFEIFIYIFILFYLYNKKQ